MSAIGTKFSLFELPFKVALRSHSAPRIKTCRSAISNE